MRFSRVLVGILLLGFVQFAFAQAQQVSAETVLSTIQGAMLPAIGKLTSQAISWLGIFATLQFFITNYNLLKSDGDIQSMVAKLFGAVAWVGICLYLINNAPSFIMAVGDQMMNLLGVNLPIVSVVIGSVVGVAGAMVVVALGVGAVSNTGGFILAVVALFILGAGLFLAFKIFMLQLEVGLIALLSPLSFSFLGLSTLKDQGIAPFKALLSLTYRILLMTVILSAFTEVGNVVKETIKAVGPDDFLGHIGTTANAILSAIGAYILLVYLTFKSDAIAASLASGSTSMGTGDVAQAAAAGAAVGAAVMSGAAAGVGAASKIPQSMSAFMDGMMGGGSISNASPMGGGGAVPVFSPPSTPALSVKDSAAGGASASMPSASPSKPSASTNMPPSRTSPSNEPITSGRFGADSPQSTGGQSTAESGASMASQGADGEGPNGAGAATSDPVTVTPADAQAKVSGSPSNATDTQNGVQDSGANAGPGSGLSAGIGGKPSLEDNLHKLVEHLASQQQGPRKPTLGERLGDANKHISQEQTATHVSINTHHTD